MAFNCANKIIMYHYWKVVGLIVCPQNSVKDWDSVHIFNGLYNTVIRYIVWCISSARKVIHVWILEQYF